MTVTTTTHRPKSRAIYVERGAGEELSVLGSTATVKATTDDTGGNEWVLVESQPGGDVPAHRHPWGESYYILDGSLEVRVGARRYIASVGDFLTIPPRAVHSFEVLSDTVRFLHVSVGEGATAMFRDVEATTAGRDLADPETQAAVGEALARHGVEMLQHQTV